MSKRLILCRLMMLAIVLTSLPGVQAQTAIPRERGDERRPRPMRISSYEDDPYVGESLIRRMEAWKFWEGEDGRPTLSSGLVNIYNGSKIYRMDTQTNQFKPFAWNPWPAIGRSNDRGDFSFPNEERFSLFKVERGSDGKIILREGLQVWSPVDLRLGMTTAFEAANAVKDAAESWAGRDIAWGEHGKLDIETQVFVDFNAFYSGTTRSLFFGVIPYRLPGETEVKIFETATSWEMVAHECGHALHHALKPNRVAGAQGYDTWSESFSDQVAMWASLRKQDRVFKLLAETGGNLNQSNFLTRQIEAFAVLTGKDNGLRDAFHEEKVSDTTEEVHDRSQVLTGAAYKLFLTIYSSMIGEQGMEPGEALTKAGEVMGMFLTRSTDFTPENIMTLEDVAKAYLKVDKEFFNSRYHAMLVDEFIRRELFDANSLNEWFAHEAATPSLYISRRPWYEEVDALIQASLDRLGIGPEFGLKLQSMVRDDLFGGTAGFGQTIVRVQLTMGRGDGATPLDNHGILVFRANGTLADYHAPLTPNASPQAQVQMRETLQLRNVILRAKRLSLGEHGAPLSIVRKPDGELTVEARVMRGEGLNAYMEVFSLDNPRGERREIVIPPVPPGKRVPIPDDIIN